MTPAGSDLGTTSGRALLRLGLGLVVGFSGAFVTLEAIDRFGPEGRGEALEVVLGAPDVDGYCGRDGERGLQGVSTTGDANGWHCVGLVQQLWTAEPVDITAVCRWHYGPDTFGRLVDASVPDGWLCVTDP